MNRKFFIRVIAGVLISAMLISFGNKRANELNGIWIPEKINWKDGSFNTIYIYNDTSFILVASSQNRNNNGTINFMVEQGFVINYGHIVRFGTDNSYAITYRLLYRSVTLSGEKLPSDIIKSLFRLDKTSKNKIKLYFNNEDYIKTSWYTKQSIEKFKALKNKLVPQVL